MADSWNPRKRRFSVCCCANTNCNEDDQIVLDGIVIAEGEVIELMSYIDGKNVSLYFKS
jgi:hypothetical protein